MLYQTLKEDLLTARKAKDMKTRAILAPLLSECEAVGKKELREPTSAEVNAVVQKFLKGARQNLELVPGNTEITFEISVYERYLPKQLNSIELRSIVQALVDANDGVNMGQVMAHLKNNYGGMYDGKVASSIVREILM